MNENLFEDIKKYDALERMLQEDSETPELKGEAKVVRLLMQDAQDQAVMPREDAFHTELMDKLEQQRSVRRTASAWWQRPGLVTAAAAVIIGALSIALWQPAQDAEQGGEGIIISDHTLNVSNHNATRRAMVDYLEEAEFLLTSIRDLETSCSIDRADLGLEKRKAKSLLLKQKTFATEIDKPHFQQAKTLFAQLESILVDLNGLDPCTDYDEVQFLNTHINKNRILSKVRLIAQDIQLT